MILILFIIFGFFQYGSTLNGVDVSEIISVKAWQCLKGYFYTKGIVRCYRSTGSVDQNCPNSIKNAVEAGVTDIDVYLFPRPSAGSGQDQVKTMVDFLKDKNATFGRVWLDIEGKQYWLGDLKKNQIFFEELLDGVKEQGVKGGIYSSYYQWEDIFGLSYNGPTEMPLWYAHYDGKQSFSDYKKFGGWDKPSMKQYAGDVSLCGVGIDKDWSP